MTPQNIDSYFEDLYDKTYKRVLAYIIAKCGDTEDISESNVKNRIYRTLKEIRSAFIRSDGAV